VVKTAEFDYRLPPELIAQTPIEPRDGSRLMVVDRSSREIAHRHFYDLPDFLRPGDLLVHNESRVIPARLFARKPTGGRVEILLLRQRAADTWEALVKGRGIRAGTRLTLLDGPDGRPVDAAAQVVEEGERGMRVLTFDRPALELAGEVGATPLPPYIHTPLEDAERYQTIYARVPGSAASSTAGLHFTPELMFKLREMGTRSAFVTLHIGLDTFRPVSEERVEDHRMHTEHCTLAPQVAKTQISNPKSQTVQPFEGATDLFIYPGFRFRVMDALVTNFHLPRSTLLMLVAAFAGKELLDRAYAEAIQERYRFYSFGDAMLIV
jgi:S-adenosylmethionine:tRNA ribosyltransferase-isomerase